MKPCRGLLLASMGSFLASQVEALEIVPSVCTRAVAAAERDAGLPSGVLLAIGFGEAGRSIEGGSTIWPWTVNVEGEGHYFASKRDAIAFVEANLVAGRRSIDVGCMQINLRWHPEAFADLEAAFDPETNAAYAARFLGALRARVAEPGMAGWLEAVGSYHSGTREFAQRYRAHVGRYWAVLDEPLVTAALEAPLETAQDMAAVTKRTAGPDIDDPLGLRLLAYWAGPFGIVSGGEDPFGMQVAGGDPFGMTAPIVPLDHPPQARGGEIDDKTKTVPKPTRAATIRRFHAVPQVIPAQPIERRPGLLRQQTKRS
jgi:hypothetical protein